MAIGSGGPWKLYTSFQGVNGALIKAVGGSISSAIVENRSGTKQYLQLFDKNSAPQSNDVPLLSIPLQPGGGGFVLDDSLWGIEGQKFQNGIAVGISTTVGTFTAGTTDVLIHIWWV